MLFSGLRSVRMVKNCDLGLENAARSQFFTIRTSQPANNIYVFTATLNFPKNWGGPESASTIFLHLPNTQNLTCWLESDLKKSYRSRSWVKKPLIYVQLRVLQMHGKKGGVYLLENARWIYAKRGICLHWCSPIGKSKVFQLFCCRWIGVFVLLSGSFPLR